MRTQSLYYILFFSLLFSCQANQSSQNPTQSQSNTVLKTKDIKRIALVGGSLISSMENYGFFERSMIQQYAGQAISFRNIAWAADDVFGVARSQFGSAQNTRSWQPPTAEEGFGSKVLMEHIAAIAPSTLIIGYGGETAFARTEEDLELFKSGYIRLLKEVERKSIKLILLSPPKQEKVDINPTDIERRNEWLSKTRDFIKEQATNKGYLFIDLYKDLIINTKEQKYTENGVQLNREGYQKMNEILLKNLGVQNQQNFVLRLDEKAQIIEAKDCKTTDWVSTVNGVSFNLKPNEMLYTGKIISKEPVAIYINGQLAANSQDTLSFVTLLQDSLEEERLMATIKEKNRLHRYRLRPLNEAYIYLFRRHEMGHLAYEMEDLKKLVEEKEREINRLLSGQKYDIEIELIKPWSPPKNYPEDEVPAFIPTPNIAEEIAAFDIADGYEISLFASDPMIANPININWDTKGRAWVATSSTYPHIVPGREPNDKVVILEDTNGDGKADKHTIFAENMLVPHSVMPVPGGAYVTASTELLYFADTNGDDIADERRVVYDGFGNADVHHMIHGLRWTPWGNLHFTQSIYINTFVETPYGTRILNGSGIWAFRPQNEQLEVYSRGLVNPWGEAFDKWGQSFATDGAGSSGFNYIFPESAHATAVGAPKILSGLNKNTPKNTGAEVIYSRHFPKSWQGTMITNDFRANRTVRYKLTPHKSGYQSEEVETVLRSDHRSYRPVDAKIGPDGALYIVDWYNPIIDHGEVDFHHPIRDKSHGRIWKLTKKGSPLIQPANLQPETATDLLALLKSPEQYTRLQANRAYVDQKGDPQAVINWIKNIKGTSEQAAQNRLEGLWLLAALDHYDEPTILAALTSTNPQARAAAVRQLANWKIAFNHRDKLASLIIDKHPQVRLEAIHALREMGGKEAAELVIKVLDHPMDENLTFALDLTLSQLKDEWLPKIGTVANYFDGDVNKKLYALLTTEDKRVVPFINQLIDQPNLDSELTTKAWKVLAKIGNAKSKAKVLLKVIQEKKASLLNFMSNAPAVYTDRPNNLDQLAVLFNQENESLRKEAYHLAGRWKVEKYAPIIFQKMEEATEIEEKIAACKALANMDKMEEIKAIAQTAESLKSRTAATAVWIEEAPDAAVHNAINLLEQIEDSKLSELIFLAFRKLENGPAILTNGLTGKRISENTANVGLKIVQTSGLPLKDLELAIRNAGNIQAIGMELSANEKSQLLKDAIENGNVLRGREIYRRPELLCGNCHRTQHAGGLSGPNLSTVGSYMTPNSLLESILNPNSDIKQNYETVLITKKTGEIISGLLHRKTNTSTLIRQANNEIVEIPTEEIAETDVSPVSLMPTGLTRNLSREELKDLLAYLINLK